MNKKPDKPKIMLVKTLEPIENLRIKKTNLPSQPVYNGE